MWVRILCSVVCKVLYPWTRQNRNKLSLSVFTCLFAALKMTWDDGSEKNHWGTSSWADHPGHTAGLGFQVQSQAKEEHWWLWSGASEAVWPGESSQSYNHWGTNHRTELEWPDLLLAQLWICSLNTSSCRRERLNISLHISMSRGFSFCLFYFLFLKNSKVLFSFCKELILC